MIGWKKTLGAALLGMMACAQAWAIPTLSVTATPGTAAPGSKISVAVSVADVTDLAGYNFNFGFDSTVLKLTDYSRGLFLGSGADQGYFGVQDGLVYAYGTVTSSLSGMSGAGTLAYFTFETLTAGMSGLNFSDVLFTDSAFNELPVTAVNGSVTVTAATSDVPEPASLMLLAAGGLAAGALRRRRAAMPA